MRDERRRVFRAYVTRDSGILTAILIEPLPDHVTLSDLASGTPLLWEEQRALLREKQS